MENTEINIPLYRGRTTDSDEYVEGWLYKYYNKTFKTHAYYIFTDHNKMFYNQIDPSTLAIHFPDMIDSEGTKIFASLNMEGVGGDICDVDDGARIGVFLFHEDAFCIDVRPLKVFREDSEFSSLKPAQYRFRTKVTGIQE